MTVAEVAYKFQELAHEGFAKCPVFIFTPDDKVFDDFNLKIEDNKCNCNLQEKD